MRLRGQIDIYRENDIWQKEQIARLSGVNGVLRTEKGLDEDKSVAKSMKEFADIVATNSKVIVDFVSTYKKEIENDQAVDRAWSKKLQQLIDSLGKGGKGGKGGTGTDPKSNTPSKKSVIMKAAGNRVLDFSIGYGANLSSARTSAFLDGPNQPSADDSVCSVGSVGSTLSSVVGSVTTATMSSLPTPATVLTSAATATIGRMPSTTTGIITAVSIAIATMLLSGVVNLGGGLDTEEDGLVGDEPVGVTEDPDHDQEEVGTPGK